MRGAHKHNYRCAAEWDLRRWNLPFPTTVRDHLKVVGKGGSTLYLHRNLDLAASYAYGIAGIRGGRRRRTERQNGQDKGEFTLIPTILPSKLLPSPPLFPSNLPAEMLGYEGGEGSKMKGNMVRLRVISTLTPTILPSKLHPSPPSYRSTDARRLWKHNVNHECGMAPVFLQRLLRP